MDLQCLALSLSGIVCEHVLIAASPSLLQALSAAERIEPITASKPNKRPEWALTISATPSIRRHTTVLWQKRLQHATARGCYTVKLAPGGCAGKLPPETDLCSPTDDCEGGTFCAERLVHWADLYVDCVLDKVLVHALIDTESTILLFRGGLLRPLTQKHWQWIPVLTICTVTGS